MLFRSEFVEDFELRLDGLDVLVIDLGLSIEERVSSRSADRYSSARSSIPHENLLSGDPFFELFYFTIESGKVVPLVDSSLLLYLVKIIIVEYLGSARNSLALGLFHVLVAFEGLGLLPLPVDVVSVWLDYSARRVLLLDCLGFRWLRCPCALEVP